MGLPARQRRVLQRIENALRGSDPRLDALYAIFGRLTRDEEMPLGEQLRHGAVRTVLHCLSVPFVALGRLRLRTRLRPGQRAVLFYPLAVALAVTSIVFAARSSPGRSCVPVRTVAAARNVARSSLCRPKERTTTYPLNAGR